MGKFNPSKRTVLYWLFDDTCQNPSTDGYVGVTQNIIDRILEHKRRGPFKNKEFIVSIISIGTLKQCMKYEKTLRPNPNVGWNEFGGGLNGYSQSKEANEKKSKSLTGRRFSEEHKRKLSERVFTPEWRQKLSISAKLGFLSGRRKPLSPDIVRIIAEKNRGKKRTPEQKRNMRIAQQKILARKLEMEQ